MEESRNSCSYMVGGHLYYVPLLFTQKKEKTERGMEAEKKQKEHRLIWERDFKK